MEKLIKEINSSKFPFLEPNNNFLGIKNGVLNIEICDFIKKEDVTFDLVVRKYFDLDLNEDEETPLFDNLIKYQFPDEDPEYTGVY